MMVYDDQDLYRAREENPPQRDGCALCGSLEHDEFDHLKAEDR